MIIYGILGCVLYLFIGLGLLLLLDAMTDWTWSSELGVLTFFAWPIIMFTILIVLVWIVASEKVRDLYGDICANVREWISKWEDYKHAKKLAEEVEIKEAIKEKERNRR